MGDELVDRIADAIFTEATRIVLDDTNDETVQRVAAIMSMCSKRLAERVVEALDGGKDERLKLDWDYDRPSAGTDDLGTPGKRGGP